MEKFIRTEYADDIAAHLLALAFPDAEDAEKLPEFEAMEHAISDLYFIAQNPYNRDEFRTFYRMLEKITQNHRERLIGSPEDLDS